MRSEPVQPRIRHVIVPVAVLALVAAVVMVVTSRDRAPMTVSASSSDAAFPAEQLGTAALDLARPLRWRSEGQTVGASVTVRWSLPTRIGAIEARAAADPTLAIRGAYLRLSDGSSLLARPDAQGDIIIAFTERVASWATLTVTGADTRATAVGLSTLRISDDVALPRPRVESQPMGAVATASSSDTGTGAAALIDADDSSAGTGAPWRSVSAEREWIEVDWPQPREVSSVQIFGSPDERGGVRSGLLEFSDGSVVVTAGVSAGDVRPTTIAFMPRVATSVRFVMEPVGDSAVALREIDIFQRGQTPPAPPTTSGVTVTVPTSSEVCSVPATPNPDPARLRLLCPKPGTGVQDAVRIVVAAPPWTTVSATAWVPFGQPGRGGESVVAQALTSPAGYAELDVDQAAMPRGPATVRLSISGDTQSLHVQLFHLAGEVAEAPETPQSRGMTLAWAEEFRSPLSISRTGESAVYAATKPSYGGPSEFGSAVFADPAWATNNVGTVAEEYLRIRVSDLPKGRKDPFGHDRTYLGGMLSSVAVGGAGFSAQYGYFEARILGAPGSGTWPAFWALSTDHLVTPGASSGEVDAVELYGHNTAGSCRAIHNWVKGEDGAQVDCDEGVAIADWALRWHTYGARVTPNGTTFFVDGTEITTLNGLINTEQPYFFMVNLAMGGGWPTDLTATGGISDAYVDYVRVYT